jgi:DNA-binding MarR family transcriptional regulator
MPAGTIVQKTAETQCNCTSLRKASRRISQLYDNALLGSGLKTTQRAILAQISRSEPTSIGKLAEALVMDAGALTHTLKPLTRDGLVAIGIDPNDRRNRQITLTAAGRARLTTSDNAWEQAQHAFEKTLGKAEAKTLRDAMRLLFSEEFSASFERHMETGKIA